MKGTEADEIIEEIRSAFEGVPRGAISIHEAEVIDVYGTEDRRREARRLDPEEHWDEVHWGSIAECTSALTYLDPVAWRFYLPAYMAWTLRHFRLGDTIRGGTTVPEHTLFNLTLSEHDPQAREHQLTRFRLLDAAQSRAVYRFLHHLMEHGDAWIAELALGALVEHWLQLDGSSVPQGIDSSARPTQRRVPAG